MAGVLPGLTRNMSPSYLDPSRKTPNSGRPRSRPKPVAWPPVDRAEDFNSQPRSPDPPIESSEPNLLDADQPGEPIDARTHEPENWKAGVMFRHRTWERDRDQVKRALETEGEVKKRYWRFRGCGSQAIVFQAPDDPTRYKIGCQRCHDRFCLPCSQDRARLIAANLRDQLPPGPTRFLTLTLKHSPDPLKEQIERLYRSFYRLRQRAFWKQRVEGGLAFLEVKLAKDGQTWHPHLHVLIRGKYLPQQLISDTWLAITSDSYIVDIRLAADPTHVYRYLAKYVTKGWSRSVYRNMDKLCECINAMKGRRLLVAFGSFSKLELLKPPDHETWLQLGTLHEVLTLAYRGDDWAVMACEALRAPGYEAPLEPIPPDE